VAIGNEAGKHIQGNYSIAIGTYAGQSNQHANTIVLNAQTATALNSTQANSFFVRPIRFAWNQHQLMYNSATGEITFFSS